MTTNSAHQPSYDDWLNQCRLFICAVKVHARKNRLPADSPSVQLSNTLEGVVAQFIDQRSCEQEENAHAPTSSTPHEVELDIKLIKDFLEKNRPVLQTIAAADTPQAIEAMHLMVLIDRENDNYSAPRATNIHSFQSMDTYVSEMQARQQMPRQGRVVH